MRPSSRAQEVWHRSVGDLADEGVAARGDTGESDPCRPSRTSLQTFPADRIMIFRHAGEDQRYREDFDLDEFAGGLRLPVEEAGSPPAEAGRMRVRAFSGA